MDKKELKILGEESFMEKWKEITVDDKSFWSNTSHKLTAIEDPEDPEMIYILHEEIPVNYDPELYEFFSNLGEEEKEKEEFITYSLEEEKKGDEENEIK